MTTIITALLVSALAVLLATVAADLAVALFAFERRPLASARSRGSTELPARRRAARSLGAPGPVARPPRVRRCAVHLPRGGAVHRRRAQLRRIVRHRHRGRRARLLRGERGESPVCQARRRAGVPRLRL